VETTKTPSVRTETIDPSIENALPENCTMSILFQEDGLVFSILRNDLQKFIVLGEYEIKNQTVGIESLFYFRDQLQGAFANYAIGYASPHFTIIPATLFNQSKLAEYANFQFDAALEDVFYDTLSAQGIVFIYTMPRQLAQFVRDNFAGVKIRHAAAFTISHYLNLYKNKPGEHLHIHIWRGRLEIVAIKNAKLLLYNTFAFETNEDLLYFILNVYEQVELNPESVPLKISGEMEKGSDMWNLLMTYIRYVEIEERMAQYVYSHEFKAFTNHRYNRVFQAAACVL
jgi:hypothetical protein